MLAVRLIKGPVVAERRDREAGENLLVDGPLDQAGLFPAPLGDHRAASPTGALEAIHFVLLPADLQRGDPQRLTFRMQQTPGLNGRVARESTRLNSSHRTISYAVFCLKKKKKKQKTKKKAISIRSHIRSSL